MAYQVTAAWPGGPTWQAGFQAQVSVKNTGTTPTAGWQVTLTFDPGVTSDAVPAVPKSIGCTAS